MYWFFSSCLGLAAMVLPAGQGHDGLVLLLGGASTAALIVGWMGWRNRTKTPPTTALLIGWAIALRIAIWVGPVRFDDDLWRYLWDGIATVEGVSPYRFAPLDVLEYDAEFDPLVLGEKEAAELARLASRASDPQVTEVLAQINFPHLPTLYPPSSQLAFVASAAVAPGNERIWRACAVAADVLVVVFLARLLAALRRPAWWLAGYALHPLPALEFAAGGHQDPVGIALLLGAALAFVGLRRVAAGALLAASAGVKLFPAVLVLAWGRRLGTPGVLALSAAGLALALPFAVLGPPDSAGLSAYASHWEFFSGPYVVLGGVADVLRLDSFLGDEALGGRFLLLGVFVSLALASRFWRRREAIPAMEQGFRWVEVLLILSPVVDPWYVPWGLALGIVRGSVAWLVLAGLIPLAYFGYTAEGHAWSLRLAVWVPFLGLWIREMGRPLRAALE